MMAAEVKAALRRRHPGDTNGAMVGQWTCIEEWRNVDLLALNAWQGGDVIGYEVKVSRSDMRGELLRPDKRAAGVTMTTEFYFAVPDGLLTAAEIAWEEPEWEPGDFERVMCPGVPPFGGPRHAHSPYERWGGRCRRDRGLRANVVSAPIPEVVTGFEWADDRYRDGYLRSHLDQGRRVPCWRCGGNGYLAKSRVERQAPTLWIPRDVGLVVIRNTGCHVVKASPKRKTPESIAKGRRGLNDLVRWVSHRPDPRHVATPIPGPFESEDAA